jgi:hypothetical protein
MPDTPDDDSMLDKAKDMAADLGDKAKDVASDVGDKAKDLASDVSDKVKDMFDGDKGEGGAGSK